MNRLILLCLMAFCAAPAVACDAHDKPVKHFQVVDVMSIYEAEEIFIEKTDEIKSKQKLDEHELHQIHKITYSLEKGMAYFVANLTGDKQELAKEMAMAVEDIHIASENNRPQELKKHLQKYFDLAEQFSAS